MRILTILSGVLMIATGAFCLMNPGQTFLSLAFIVGLIMVLNGLIHALAYFIGRGLHNKGDNNGWILTDALITLLLGILILCNQLVADTAIPLVFGMWMFVAGILRIEAATHIDKQRKLSNFRTTMVTGLITVLVGLFGFINPLVQWMTAPVLVGIFLLMQGVNVIELGIHMPHEKKPYVKIYKKRREPIKITEEDETPEKVLERLKMREAEEAAAAAAAAGMPVSAVSGAAVSSGVGADAGGASGVNVGVAATAGADAGGVNAGATGGGGENSANAGDAGAAAPSAAGASETAIGKASPTVAAVDMAAAVKTAADPVTGVQTDEKI